MPNGLVHIYTGDGKGKTTAAAGLAARCVAYGGRVIFYQFLKNSPSGEILSLQKLGVKVLRPNKSSKFYYDMNDDEKIVAKNEVQDAIKHIYDMEASLIILDEINCVLDLGIVKIDDVISLIKSKPKDTELVLTGRNAPLQLFDYVDYVSEIKCVKHPYDKNISSRRGIEY